METILTWLNQAVEGAPVVSLTAALVWGVLSVVCSPCHLASIPLIVGYINGQERMTARRATAVSSLFAAGILVTIAIIGAITAALSSVTGRIVGDIGPYGTYIVAGIFFIVGLHLLDVIPLPLSAPGQVSMKRRGLLGGFILGLIFGVALGPCTFAYMAPVLAMSIKLSSDRPAWAGALLAAYGLGHCIVIALAGASTGLVQRWLDWNQRSRGAVILRRICGLAVLGAGLYLVYKA